MKIHILGVCGTFMAGIALLAKQKGHEVTGFDEHIYPPMSTQLASSGISLVESYQQVDLLDQADCIVVGNAMIRGNPAIEYMLNKGLPFMSGPAWLARFVLHDKWVLAVAGTHGKTTTSCLLTWILKYAGMKPGFLIGGIAPDLVVSSRLGESDFFVVEADEYDSAFFDKRSKFIHYLPRTLIINNIEFDHADIFDSIDDIKKQFHHLCRTVAGSGLIISPNNDPHIKDVLQAGCWSELQFLGHGAEWEGQLIKADGSQFTVTHHHHAPCEVNWSLLGQHNVDNAIAAIAAAAHVGVKPELSAKALQSFKGVMRRLELIATIADIKIYDDFAHHPTAIATTLDGLRQHVGKAKIIAVLELASFTMRSGYHQDSLKHALSKADVVILLGPANDLVKYLPKTVLVKNHAEEIIDAIVELANSGDHIVIMSNRSFDGIYIKLPQALQEKFGT